MNEVKNMSIKMKKANITNGVDLSVAETRWIGESIFGHYRPSNQPRKVAM